MSSIVSIDSLSGLVAFSVAVETGSFAAAGRKLGLSASAVGKAVERLEARLGLRLLNRTTRSLAATGEGDILYRYVARILKELQDAEQELHLVQKAPRGRLKVSVPTVLGRKIIMPALLDFRTLFPEVTTDISLDDVKVDIIEGGYDVVLRLGELDDSILRARRIGPHTFITCASPEYLARRGIPQSPADLHDHCCVYYRFPTTGRQEVWAFKNSHQAVPIKPCVVLNDGEALASAALGGLGIIQAPSYLVSDDIAAGRLQAVLTDYTDERGSVSLVWPPMSARAPKVRAFIDFMAERVSQKLY
ncbi:DNA-binding transcriptional LysR family regulator [Phyllobacterium ifriqiyense]|uniref:DNA-binding transcriptional LysR family regulator n=1 Tax=Phyllobacterium ifriqiyense TaxID=314238 RepID=A0ABU0S6V6_9HYPH|nr:LysR family transcriptional regulator [Phyllobacterium ifriqiyense]MDQ0996246.1 DNA-binding transcriptional LysR family regulator [Phyllobacterium ifriqiyense]